MSDSLHLSTTAESVLARIAACLAVALLVTITEMSMRRAHLSMNMDLTITARARSGQSTSPATLQHCGQRGGQRKRRRRFAYPKGGLNFLGD